MKKLLSHQAAVPSTVSKVKEAAPYAIDATHREQALPTRYLTTLSHDFGAFARALGAVSSPVTRRIWFLITVS